MKNINNSKAAAAIIACGALALVSLQLSLPERDPYPFLHGQSPFGSFREFGGSTTIAGRTYSFKSDFLKSVSQIDQQFKVIAKKPKTAMKLGPNQEYYIWSLPGGRTVHAKPARILNGGMQEVRPDWTLIMIVDEKPSTVVDRARYWLRTHSPF
ncbi:MAG: hypothetical protein ABL949_01640 [Fimbriimonadaceae bacterium]